MADAKTLERFLAVSTNDGAELVIEVEGQAPITVSVSLEQIEDMLDTPDESLDASDIEDDEEEDEEFEDS